MFSNPKEFKTSNLGKYLSASASPITIKPTMQNEINGLPK